MGKPWVPPRQSQWGRLPFAREREPAPVLQEYLQREIDGAAAVQEPHRVMQVDVVAGCEDERALGVVPRALELLVPPLLDSIYLGDVQSFEFRRRHRSPPFANGGLGIRSLAYSSITTYRTSPFWGDCVVDP